jgi:hypothetical protein
VVGISVVDRSATIVVFVARLHHTPPLRCSYPFLLSLPPWPPSPSRSLTLRSFPSSLCAPHVPFGTHCLTDLCPIHRILELDLYSTVGTTRQSFFTHGLQYQRFLGRIFCILPAICVYNLTKRTTNIRNVVYMACFNPGHLSAGSCYFISS